MLPCILSDDCVIDSAWLIIPAVLSLQRWQQLRAFSHAEVRTRLPPACRKLRGGVWCVSRCKTIQQLSPLHRAHSSLLHGDVIALEAHEESDVAQKEMRSLQRFIVPRYVKSNMKRSELTLT